MTLSMVKLATLGQDGSEDGTRRWAWKRPALVGRILLGLGGQRVRALE